MRIKNIRIENKRKDLSKASITRQMREQTGGVRWYIEDKNTEKPLEKETNIARQNLILNTGVYACT